MISIHNENPGERSFMPHTLMDHLNAGVVVHAPDTSILYSNVEASRLLGLSLDQMHGRVAIDPSWRFLREDGTQLPLTEYPVNKVITTRQPIKNLEGGINRPDSDDKVWVLVNAMPEFDDQQQLKHVVVIFTDITLRRQVEFEMKVLAEIVEGVLHTKDLNDLLKLIHQSLKKVLFAENCFFALYDPETDLFNFPYFVDQFDQQPSPQKLNKACTRYVFRTGKSILITPEKFQELKDQKEVELIGAASLSWIGIPLQTSAGVVGVMVLQHYSESNVFNDRHLSFLDSIASQVANVIERKRAEEELVKSYSLFETTFKSLSESEARLRELNATKDKFFSIIAHDLKSPFNSILGFSDILTSQIRKKDYEGIEEYGEIIYQSSKRAMDLLTNLIEWSRSQSGRMDFNPEYIELGSLLKEIMGISNVSARQKSIRLTQDVPKHLSVFLDKRMISSVIRNLISNAIKFTHPGGKIVFRAELLPKEIQISVKDNGIGIAQQHIHKLFKIDETYSIPGTHNERGTGLGLILCKEFVEMHQGKIWVETEQNKGSTFYFTIPKY